MSNDYRNCEGYPDPTAGEALSGIAANEKQSLRAFRPIVYICSPFSGDVETNVANARRYSRYAVDKGYIPTTPSRMKSSGSGICENRPRSTAWSKMNRCV